MHPMLNIAVRAARAAGNVIVRYVERVDVVEFDEKGRNDFVSQVDREAEARIIQTIRKAFPEHSILAEESGHRPGDDFQWVIDPLDGTTNFLHGFPHFAVSIALKYRDSIEQGVIFDPLRQEMFTATRGGGAQIDDRRIRVSRRQGLKGALLGTGFPFRDLRSLETHLSTLGALIPKTAGVRRAGSAALDLAYVAAGRLDGFWEFGLKEWDLAAGVLMVREAGGLVTDPAGGEDCFERGDVLAAPPRVHAAMLTAIGPALRRPAADAAAVSGRGRAAGE